MANLISECELCYLQLFPKGGDETPISKEEFVETGLSIAAKELWLQVWGERNADGYYEVPSYLLKQIEVDIVNNEADLSQFDIVTGLPKDIWLQKVGSLTDTCEYIKTTINLSQLLTDEDDRGHGYRTYLPIGRKVKFPQGVHKNKMTFIVAGLDENAAGEIEISGDIAANIRTKLIETYGGRIGKEDVTNNSTPEL